ncbi:ECF transporter S component [Kocuria sp. JC486]|uniref:general stress protein n=1 Tax=Kocuria sp. JC486 TaxID=1970736 RepID=UPI00142187D8|nr:general stress protein [Kocuria sp. JC486]NHU85529.1 ECF transporter S component [Kocuria sp. JC486]
MSLFGQRPSSMTPSGPPEGETIGSFERYADAQTVVDHLSDQQFDVQHVSIVGRDLTSVERVTGRLTYPRVALASALQGAMFGLFFGVILAMFGGSGWGASVLLTVLMGAAFWVILGVAGFAAQRGRRDFTSVSTVAASRYEVVVKSDLAGQARGLVAGLDVPGLRGAGQGARNAPGRAPVPGPAPANGAEAPSTGGETRTDTDAVHPSGRVPSSEEDLPDGRPRYGVRVDPQEPAAPQSAPQNTPSDQAYGEPTREL